MTDRDELAAAYDRSRPRLVRVAYAVLGSLAEAEDVVSECWLRLVTAHERDPVRDVDAWATTACTRAALDALRSARVRREQYVGPWLPEPLVGAAASVQDPADRVALDDTVSYALLVVLETLTPAERTAYVLHDLFDVPFPQVAETVGRSAAAVRQLAARARSHVRAGAPRLPVDPAEHRAVVARFLDAAAGGDVPALIAALDPEVVLTSDGGGHVTAARRPVCGADTVARFLLSVARQLRPTQRLAVISVNGATGLGVYDDHQLVTVVSLTVRNDHVQRIDLVRSPCKLPRPADAARRGA